MINTKPIKTEQKDNHDHEGEVDVSVVSDIEDSPSTSIEDQFEQKFEHLKLSLSLAAESTIRNVISFYFLVS